MNHLTIAPMQWAKLEDLHDVAPIANDDIECMKDIREVLLKHGKLDRFALHLIHKHFDIDEDEVLVEYSDADEREQYFKVEKRGSEVLNHAIPTTWTLEDVQPLVSCVCATRMGQGHLGRHETN